MSRYLNHQSTQTFNFREINELNGTRRWNYNIKLPSIGQTRASQSASRPNLPATSNLPKLERRYRLYATGDADVNGRVYVALPKDTQLTSKIIKKHNLW